MYPPPRRTQLRDCAFGSKFFLIFSSVIHLNAPRDAPTPVIPRLVSPSPWRVCSSTYIHTYVCFRSLVSRTVLAGGFDFARTLRDARDSEHRRPRAEQHLVSIKLINTLMFKRYSGLQSDYTLQTDRQTDDRALAHAAFIRVSQCRGNIEIIGGVAFLEFF